MAVSVTPKLFGPQSEDSNNNSSYHQVPGGILEIIRHQRAGPGLEFSVWGASAIIVVLITILLALFNLAFLNYQYPAEIYGSAWERKLCRAEEERE